MTDLPWWFIPVFTFGAFMVLVVMLTLFVIVHDFIVGRVDPVQHSHRVVHPGERVRS